MTLLGRNDERTRIDDALDACMRGATGIMLVEGGAGCGKSALLHYCADAARRRGATTVDAAYPARPAEPTALSDTAARHAPTVICLDDIGHADAGSRARLTALVATLAHTGRDSGLLLVLTAGTAQPPDPALDTELLRHPAATRILLGPLARPTTAELLRLHTGQKASTAAADSVHRTSGGNPLLIRALLSEPGCTPRPHGPFSRAVGTCLQRCGTAASDLARALAALGDSATADRAARVLRRSPQEVTQALSTLDAAGLTDGHRLRHPLARAAALDAMEPAERKQLHRRAARALHETRAEASVIADRLRACGEVDEDWAVHTLREAAQQAMATDDPERAAAYLELAHTACTIRADHRTRATLALQLAALTWRMSPAAAEHHLREPLARLRAGHLEPDAAAQLARLLSAQGRLEEAAEALHHAPGTEILRELFALQPDESRPAPPGGEHLNACAALWTHPGHEHDVHDAERFLEATPAAQSTHEPLTQALRTLIHADQPHKAAAWSRRLQTQATAHRAPGWQAVYCALEGEALLRLGDLAGAERAAATAVRAVTGRGGRFCTTPLAVLVMALTAMGRYDEAVRHLETLDHDGVRGTVHVLPLLRARGQYFLATHRAEAALGAFLEAGRLAARWGLDRPRQHPWRTDAAQALLRTGRRQEARALITEHQALPTATGPWLNGIALRLRAATEPPRERTRILARAVAELRTAGDRLELARALADLGQSLQTLGEGACAGSVVRRAWNLAADCGATPLCEEILPGRDLDARTPARTAGGDGRAGRLSESEQRVAALAAAGYTNREIATELFITASTVEQHLTRIYRKLQVSRRRDLPLDLDADVAAPARST